MLDLDAAAAGPPTLDGDALPATPSPTARAEAALDAAGVRWTRLRDDPDPDSTEVDLLVAPADHDRVASVLADVGFVRFPAIGHGGHRFFRTYDAAADRWTTLDVVTELAYGRSGELELTGAVEGLLAARIADEAGSRPSPSDAFWTLALHDVLDRGELAAKHREALAALAPAADASGAVRAALVGTVGTSLVKRLAAAIVGENAAAALATARAMRRRWLTRRPAAVLGRRLRGIAARSLRKPWTVVGRPGIGVALLGPDGAGKSSLAGTVGHGFPVPVRTVYLGLHGGDLAVSHRFGIAWRLARLWRGWLLGLWHRRRGRLVIYDRHGLDARLPRPGASLRSRTRRWILGHAIPVPQLVLVLDAPAEVLFARKGEHDEATLRAQRRAYLTLASRLSVAQVVDASRPRDEVRRDVVDRVWHRLAAGYRG